MHINSNPLEIVLGFLGRCVNASGTFQESVLAFVRPQNQCTIGVFVSGYLPALNS